MAKAVVVLSGGQDSATCLALAVKKYGAREVAAITFAYGQRHAVETKYARQLVKSVPVAVRPAASPRTAAALSGSPCKILHKVVRFGFYKDITANALFDPTMKISRRSRSEVRLSEAKQPKAYVKNGIDSSSLHLHLTPTPNSPPNTVVEGRNAFFLMAAAVWAKTLGATVLYTGVSQTDFSGYPDCRAVFIRAQEKAIRLALDYPIKIVTPFMKMTKADEWALAAKLGIFDVIANETVTCYNGIPGKGCGKCPACRLRNHGLKEYERSLRGR